MVNNKNLARSLQTKAFIREVNVNKFFHKFFFFFKVDEYIDHRTENASCTTNLSMVSLPHVIHEDVAVSKGLLAVYTFIPLK